MWRLTRNSVTWHRYISAKLSEMTVALVAIRAIRMAVCLSTKTNSQIAQDLQE